jgi:hypothetical protein
MTNIAVRGAEAMAGWLVSALRELDPSLLQLVAERVKNLTREEGAALLHKVIVPSHTPVDGADYDLIGFKYVSNDPLEIAAALLAS